MLWQIACAGLGWLSAIGAFYALRQTNAVATRVGWKNIQLPFTFICLTVFPAVILVPIVIAWQDPVFAWAAVIGWTMIVGSILFLMLDTACRYETEGFYALFFGLMVPQITATLWFFYR